MDPRTSGPVNGSALNGEYVHHATPGEPGRLYLVRGHADNGQYRIKLVGHDHYETTDLRDAGWTFHPEPDTVVMTTRDGRGNKRTWLMGGKPAFADFELNTRRALKRHWVVYGVPNAEVMVQSDWYWTTRALTPSR